MYQCSTKTSLVRAGAPYDETRGWRSRYYAAKEPALSLAVEAEAKLPLRFVTVMGNDPCVTVALQSNLIHAEHDGAGLTVTLHPPGSLPIVRALSTRPPQPE